MKPLIKYRGGKSREIPRIMCHVPRFAGRYVEPFLGGGALFFYLEPRMAILNDINAKLIKFYKGVRDEYAGLRAELDDIETLYARNRMEYEDLKAKYPDVKVEDKNEELYYNLRDMFNGISNKKYSDALLYYYINKTAYSGMIRYNSKGEFNVPFGRYKNLNTSSVTQAHSRLLQRAYIYNTDYRDIFDICGVDDFVFLDPPYDCIFSDYGNEEYKTGFNEDEHKRLAKDFANLPCKALMVIGRTPITEELYKGYIVDEYAKNYAVNIRNRFKSAAKHIIVANYRKSWGFVGSSVSMQNANHDLETSQIRLFEAEQPYGKACK